MVVVVVLVDGCLFVCWFVGAERVVRGALLLLLFSSSVLDMCVYIYRFVCCWFVCLLC